MAEGIGECEKIHVEEGDVVKAGAVLAELDKKEILATIGQTEVHVRQTKTALDISERSLAEGIGAKAERDNAQFAHEQAVAALNMQKVQFEKMTIRAPISGIVTKRNVQEGQLVSAGAAVFQIVDPDSFMLTINVPEKDLARLREGQVAKVTVDALGDAEFDATVRRVNPAVDATSGTVKVTLDFAPDVRAKLRESAFARVRLVLDTHQNALLVAKDTLVEENARKYVFVIKQRPQESPPAEPEGQPSDASSDQEAQPPASEAAPADSGQLAEPDKPVFKAERVEVQIGLEDSKHVEVLSGLDDQALVVTLGQQTLKTGSLVTITNASDQILAQAGLSAEEALKVAREKRARQQAGQRGRIQHREHHH
jgi:RND family efflux transporter MFP subunit